MKIAFVMPKSNGTPYSEFIPLALVLREQGDEPFFLTGEQLEQHLKLKLIHSGVPFYEGEKRRRGLPSDETHGKKSNTTLRRLLHNVRKSMPAFFKQCALFLTLVYKYHRLSNIVQKVFEVERPDVVIVYGDRTLELTPPAIKYMRKLGKPVIDIQVGFNSLEFLYTSVRKGNPTYSTDKIMNRVVAWLWPSQARAFGTETVLFYPWYLTITLAVNDMLPRKPWLVGESWATKHLMLSEAALNAHKSEGAEGSNVVVVGQLAHDVLRSAYLKKEKTKTMLLAKYFDIKKDSAQPRSLFILALPHFYEHNLMSSEDAHNEIDNLMHAVSSLPGVLILLSLHPKMQLERYLFIESKFPNARIAKTERLHEILPAGEVFINAFPSTLVWAAMCDVIPVCLNFYSFDVDFSSIPKARLVNERKHLKRLLQNPDKEWVPHGDRSLLPPFDGNSGDRIVTAIHRAVYETR